MMLGDMAAVIADGVRHIYRPIGAAGLDRHVEQIAVLFLGEVLLQIQVQSTAAIEVLGHFRAMEHKLIKRLGSILDHIEVAVVAVTRDDKAILLIPLGILHAEVFSGDVLGIEHQIIGLCGLVFVVDDLKHGVGEVYIVLIVRRDGVAQELAALDIAIDADGKELFPARYSQHYRLAADRP